jgi:hypothetical protein
LLTGSYRQEEVLELWDLRKFEKCRTYDWNGPVSADPLENHLVGKTVYEGGNEEVKEEEEAFPLTNDNHAPFIYAASFNNRCDAIMAAGAGSN